MFSRWQGDCWQSSETHNLTSVGSIPTPAPKFSMSELTTAELQAIKSRTFGEYCVNAPSIGPFEAFRMVEGVNLPEWGQRMVQENRIGFFKDKTPQTVGKYWMNVQGKAKVLQQGDWFVRVQEEPEEVVWYTPEMFNVMFGAKEILAPDGIEEPIRRLIELYSPSADAATLSGEIKAYLETSTENWMSKAYYHYLEILQDMLINGPIQAHMGPIVAYTEKLESAGGQVRRSKYYQFLKRACDLLKLQD